MQREINQFTLDEKKKAVKLTDDYLAAKDPVEKAKLREQLVLHGVIKENEPTSEKTTYTYDDAGNKTGELKEKVKGQRSEGTTNTAPAVTQAAIEKLLANPDKASDFDAKFGQGKAAAILSKKKEVTDNTPVASGPKEGDTRQVSAGRGQGTKTQVYARTGRGGSSFAWVDQ